MFSHTFLTCTLYQMKTYGTLPRVTLIQSKLVYNSHVYSSQPVYKSLNLPQNFALY